MGKPPELHQDVLDALVTLTNLTPGDVFYKIQDGGFKALAVDALRAFTKNYYMMDRKEDSAPVDDQAILQTVLEDFEEELEVTTDPIEVRDLLLDISNLKQRIAIETET